MFKTKGTAGQDAAVKHHKDTENMGPLVWQKRSE